MVGLPGNPVSSMVCGQIFLLPMVRKMLGLTDVLPEVHSAPLAQDLAANGGREHYMRAIMQDGKITPLLRQDSGLLTVLSAANALLIRAPHADAAEAGTAVSYLPL
jgi:molybdopterin molybdotransferase